MAAAVRGEQNELFDMGLDPSVRPFSERFGRAMARLYYFLKGLNMNRLINDVLNCAWRPRCAAPSKRCWLGSRGSNVA